MPPFDESSRCSAGQPVGFRWFGFPTCSPGSDLDAATVAFFTALEADGRVWNPYNKAMAKVEFERRIEKAKRGELRPVAEVKAVDIENPPPLYEIRWQTINVTSVVDGVSTFGKVLVRLYHSEPGTAPSHFIGHHIHEKDLAGDINDAQDQEIKIAKKFYDSGEPAFWGIADPAAAI